MSIRLTAAAIIPVIGFVGSAVDIGRAYMTQLRLQQACDAGVLAVDGKMVDRPHLEQARRRLIYQELLVLQAALALCSLLRWGHAAPPRLLGLLLDAQRPDGAWPRAALYHGGRRRRRDGSFEAPHPDTPHWGSEALTTAFALEALARLEGGRSWPAT